LYHKELFCTFANEIGYGGGDNSPLVCCNNPNMILKDSIYQIVESYLIDTDYYLVDVKTTSDNRISVEIDSFEGVSIDFCAELNKHIEAQFDREIEDFELEVSSAGLTEPFKVTKQYEKNIGNEVETLTKTGIKYSGILTEVHENEFVLEIEKMVKHEGSKRKTAVIENFTFKYEEIKHTKYIIRFK
jgi:ribosome maturation factor RimP